MNIYEKYENMHRSGKHQLHDGHFFWEKASDCRSDRQGTLSVVPFLKRENLKQMWLSVKFGKAR